ncbi:D-tyrosyl-tRNA(Tyr) deacylase [Auxenochlorella protothecoides]|uniref:D-aminoacyl-tRNA deacylase n=1 Tax=Auxenochlorella protothecoides TaxID=3075 RepID=A0A087SH29_AUXPR|nr:D-tyrosyl-tRNA(Tyr) deacylase [Auxenochlorella protothecoides]KFM25033.1 D-tyrosyl-tRNA(Tyr) deacylase [Auxenochlorella protothecoides]
MRTVIQRVKSASVSVDGEVVSSIGPGLLCYIGLGKDDSEEDAAYIIRKILGIRLWPSQDGKKPWHRNVQDVDGSVLCVSQFTLFGRLSGNKPDYSRAQSPNTARDQYHAVLEALGKAYRPERVRDGVFGAMMDVASVNDGPETDTPLEFDDSRILDSPVLDETFYESDEFRMWEMKAAAHDWTTCPFAHAGEKAVRRAPRTHDYTGIACPDMKRNNSCPRGDRCPYSHNVFEYWLHPTRYRTQLCNDGPACRRRPCFFAHSLEQLRQSDVRPFVSPQALARVGTEGTLPFMTRWSAPGRLASDPGEDTEATLVALLASLKVERTRHLGNTACTNHEVVISTLHQVLQQAKQAQRSLGHSASEGESSCGSPPWTRRLEGRDQVPAAYQDHLDGRGRKGSGMNPLGLNLRNFSVAETDSGVVGFAQLKPLTASSVELASLVILEKHRFVGV